MNNETIDILSLTYTQFLQKIKFLFGKGEYHAKAIYRELLKNGNKDFSHLPVFEKSGDLATRIFKQITYPSLKVTKVHTTSVTKFLTEFDDGKQVESVIIPINGGKRTTLCVSSQVGCRMACSFCKTGEMGFTRNLTVSEIVGQVYVARFHFGADIRNIVFMGMGEPLDNFENVMQAISVLNDQRGFDIALKRITVSTSGVVKGINEMVKRGLTSIPLAISLNGAEDKIRQKIMPITHRYSIAELKEALLNFHLPKGAYFFIEYVLLKGINDSYDDAMRIVEFCSGLSVMVNLIPYNGNTYQAPSREDIDTFKDYLFAKGLFVSVRTERGGEISAACGQLASEG